MLERDAVLATEVRELDCLNTGLKVHTDTLWVVTASSCVKVSVRGVGEEWESEGCR